MTFVSTPVSTGDEETRVQRRIERRTMLFGCAAMHATRAAVHRVGAAGFAIDARYAGQFAPVRDFRKLYDR